MNYSSEKHLELLKLSQEESLSFRTDFNKEYHLLLKYSSLVQDYVFLARTSEIL